MVKTVILGCTLPVIDGVLCSIPPETPTPLRRYFQIELDDRVVEIDLPDFVRHDGESLMAFARFLEEKGLFDA